MCRFGGFSGRGAQLATAPNAYPPKYERIMKITSNVVTDTDSGRKLVIGSEMNTSAVINPAKKLTMTPNPIR